MSEKFKIIKCTRCGYTGEYVDFEPLNSGSGYPDVQCPRCGESGWVGGGIEEITWIKLGDDWEKV